MPSHNAMGARRFLVAVRGRGGRPFLVRGGCVLDTRHRASMAAHDMSDVAGRGTGFFGGMRLQGRVTVVYMMQLAGYGLFFLWRDDEVGTFEFWVVVRGFAGR